MIAGGESEQYLVQQIVSIDDRPYRDVDVSSHNGATGRWPPDVGQRDAGIGRGANTGFGDPAGHRWIVDAIADQQIGDDWFSGDGLRPAGPDLQLESFANGAWRAPLRRVADSG